MRTLATHQVEDTYLKLVQAFPLRRIQNDADHAAACDINLRLSSQAEENDDVCAYLDVLVDLIIDYEKRAGYQIDTSDVTAADIVRHLAGERGLSITQLAKETGLKQSNLSEMLAGKRDWSKSAIRALSKYLGIAIDKFFAHDPPARSTARKSPMRNKSKKSAKSQT